MDIVCNHCGAAGPASNVEVVEGQVRVTCGSCGHASVLGGGAAVAGQAPRGPRELDPGLPPVKCPKCGHRQYDESACHKCGLMFSKVREGITPPWERHDRTKRDKIAQAQRLWEAVVASPADAARHAAFVDFCRTNAIADHAARRYRHYVADHPSDALAQRYLQQTVQDAHAVAQALVSSASGDFSAGAKRVRHITMAFVILLLVALAVFAFRTFQQQAAPFAGY